MEERTYTAAEVEGLLAQERQSLEDDYAARLAVILARVQGAVDDLKQLDRLGDGE